MKKLLVISSFLIAGIASFAQNNQANTLFQFYKSGFSGNYVKGTVFKVYGSIYGDTTYVSTLPLTYTPSQAGALDYTNNQLYVYSGSAWVAVGSGGGGGGSATHTNGYGILGSPYNTTVPQTWSIDTSVIATINLVNNYFNDTGVTVSVVDYLNTPPTSPVNGSFYLIGTNPNGIWTGHQNQIAQRVGTGWSYANPVSGQQVSVASLGGANYLFNGTAWTALNKPWLTTGNKQNGLLTAGTKDVYPVRFITSNITRDSIDANGKEYRLKYKNPADTIYKIALIVNPLTGEIDTIHGGLFSLTTNNSSGASTFNPITGVLNIPQYSGGGGGSGTVTSVSGLTPLFTVSNPNTTPTFALSNAAAHTFFGNNTGSSAVPSYSAINEADVTNLVSDLAGKAPTFTITAPITYSSNTIGITQATTSTNGYLSSTDWNTFNNKQAALGFTPENVANKATSFGTLNNTLYPTTQAVETEILSKGYSTGTITGAGNATAQGITNTGSTSGSNVIITPSFSYLDYPYQSTDPAAPAANFSRVYYNTNGAFTHQNSSGHVKTISLRFPASQTWYAPYRQGGTFADSTRTDSLIALKENSLGNPSTNGYVLASTTTGTRSWVALPSGSTSLSNVVNGGYRLINATKDSVRTLFVSPGQSLDSNTNSKGITLKVNGFQGFDSITTTNSIVGYGNSVMAGSGVTGNGIRFFDLVADAMKLTGTNRGIGATTFTKASNGDSSFVDRFYTVPPYSSSISYFLLEYGINDMGLHRGATNFGAVVSNYIDSLTITRGYPANRIVIILPNYIGSNNAYSGTTNDSLLLYSNALKSVALAKKTLYVDENTYFINNGSGKLLNSDSIHPTNAGHAMYAKGILTTLFGGVNATQLYVSGGLNLGLTAHVESPLSWGGQNIAKDNLAFFDDGTTTGYSGVGYNSSANTVYAGKTTGGMLFTTGQKPSTATTSNSAFYVAGNGIYINNIKQTIDFQNGYFGNLIVGYNGGETNTAGIQYNTSGQLSVSGRSLGVTPSLLFGSAHSTAMTASNASFGINGSNQPFFNSVLNSSTSTTIPQVLSVTTGINAKTTGSTTLYTVPTGKTLVVTGLEIIPTTATGVTASASASLTGSTAGTILASNAWGITVTPQVFTYPVSGVIAYAVAGETISLNIGTAATGTTLIISAHLIGYLYDFNWLIVIIGIGFAPVSKKRVIKIFKDNNYKVAA